FFFSSRRRHTRSKRDWSSDVCSSDLCKADALPADLILHVRYYYLIFILINQSLFNFFLKNMYSLAASYSCGTSVQLPSALESLTAVFDMGTGVASPPSPPDY